MDKGRCAESARMPPIRMTDEGVDVTEESEPKDNAPQGRRQGGRHCEEAGGKEEG
jgi:hypothetical protein